MAEMQNQSFLNSPAMSFRSQLDILLGRLRGSTSEPDERLKLDRVEDPLAELKLLQENDGIEAYHERFEQIRSRVNLSEDYLVSLYLEGLNEDTRINVRMFQPQTIRQCFSIGRLYERYPPNKQEPVATTDVILMPEVSEVDSFEDEGKEMVMPVTFDIESSMNQMDSVLVKDCATLISQDQATIHNDSSGQNHSSQHEETSQVQLSDLEPGLQFCKDSLVLCGNFSSSKSVAALFASRDEIFQVSFVLERDEWSQESAEHKDLQCAHQVFDQMPLRDKPLGIKRKSLFLKNGSFKFKQRTINREERIIDGGERLDHHMFRKDWSFKYKDHTRQLRQQMNSHGQFLKHRSNMQRVAHYGLLKFKNNHRVKGSKREKHGRTKTVIDKLMYKNMEPIYTEDCKTLTLGKSVEIETSKTDVCAWFCWQKETGKGSEDLCLMTCLLIVRVINIKEFLLFKLIRLQKFKSETMVTLIQHSKKAFAKDESIEVQQMTQNLCGSDVKEPSIVNNSQVNITQCAFLVGGIEYLEVDLMAHKSVEDATRVLDHTLKMKTPFQFDFVIQQLEDCDITTTHSYAFGVAYKSKVLPKVSEKLVLELVIFQLLKEYGISEVIKSWKNGGVSDKVHTSGQMEDKISIANFQVWHRWKHKNEKWQDVVVMAPQAILGQKDDH